MSTILALVIMLASIFNTSSAQPSINTTTNQGIDSSLLLEKEDVVLRQKKSILEQEDMPTFTENMTTRGKDFNEKMNELEGNSQKDLKIESEIFGILNNGIKNISNDTEATERKNGEQNSKTGDLILVNENSEFNQIDFEEVNNIDSIENDTAIIEGGDDSHAIFEELDDFQAAIDSNTGGNEYVEPVLMQDKLVSVIADQPVKYSSDKKSSSLYSTASHLTSGTSEEMYQNILKLMRLDREPEVNTKEIIEDQSKHIQYVKNKHKEMKGITFESENKMDLTIKKKLITNSTNEINADNENSTSNFDQIISENSTSNEHSEKDIEKIKDIGDFTEEDEQVLSKDELLELNGNDDDFNEEVYNYTYYQMDQVVIPKGDIEGSFINAAKYKELQGLQTDTKTNKLQHNETEVKGQDTGVTLAFVFDRTGSMWDDLVQVKKGARLIMETMLERADSPIYNYVLVPFHDPEIGPATITTDHAVLQVSLDAIEVNGGNNCPEMSVGAIKLALELSRPNSFIYVFTDATAEDYKLIDPVLKLIQKKKSQIVFVLTGDCGKRESIGYQVYEKIASTSSGQIFNLINKTDVEDVLKYVNATLQSRRVNLLSVNKPDASTDEHAIFIDDTLQEFTISVSGLNPTINVTDPDGNVVDSLPQLQPLLTLDNVKIVNVIEPDVGEWKVTVHSDSAHTVRSTGTSDFDFTNGFAIVVTDKMKETYHRPMKGARNSILVQATDLSNLFNLTKVKIIDHLNGTTVKEIPLHAIREMPGLYRSGLFVPSNDFFYLGVEGFGKDGTPIKRITSTAIQSQKPGPPEVHMKTQQTGWVNEPTILECSVQSLVPFTVAWYKDGKPISTSKQYKQTADVLWLLKTTEEDSEGNYTCQANNVAGRETKATYLTITGQPPITKTLDKTVALPNGVAVMDCLVTSNLTYNVSWYHITSDILHPAKNILISLQNNFKTKIHTNHTLVIKYANVADEGWYLCSAESKGGKSESRVHLSMREPLQVHVSPERFEFQYGNTFTMSCLVSGTPAPTLMWKKDGEIIEEDGQKVLIEKSNGLDLTVKYAKDNDEGKYECIAQNDADIDVGTSEGRYVEPPLVVAEEGSQLSKSGEDALLKCVVKGVPQPIVSWLYNGKEIDTNSGRYQVSGDGSLRITNSQTNDAGEYTCVAENQLGTESDFIILDVGMPPHIAQPPKVVNIDINTNGSIHCMAAGLPPPTISWRRKDNNTMKAHRFATTESGKLMITEISNDDGGTYICLAENTFGTVEMETEVAVTGIVKPVFDTLTHLQPETTVIIGQRLALSCSVIIGNPRPTTTWYRDGEVLDLAQLQHEGMSLEKDTLVINYAASQNAGLYECVVSNEGGTASQTTAVKVLVPPSFSDTENKVYKVNEESSVEIPCEVKGQPKPFVTWDKDGMPLLPSQTVYKNEEDNSLIITEASEDDTGAYTCNAVNAAGFKAQTTVLVVQVPPMIFDTPDVVTAIEGSVTTLYCEVRAVPTAKMVWYRDDILVSSYRDDVEYLDNNQAIRFVANLSDTGLYKCDARNEAGENSRDMVLAVMVSPSIHPPNNENYKTTAGQNVTLECHVSGYPLPYIMWQKNGGDLVNDLNVTATDDGKLILHEVGPDATGFYICDAENEAGITQKIFHLQVNVLPKILEELPLSVKLMEGEDFSVPCTAEGIPAPYISWRRNGKSIVGFNEEDAILLDDGTLVLINASETTNGLYTCSAENGEGIDQKNYIIQILVPPSMLDSGETAPLEVVEGDKSVMTCPAIDAIPAPHIQWLKNSLPLDNLINERSDDVHLSVTEDGRTLTLEEARPSDSGQYSCIATNLAGQTNATFTLDVLMLPEFDTFETYQRENKVVVGETITLECNVTGKPKPRLSWKKNNIPITSHTSPGVVLSQDKHMLHIPKVRLHDAGLYQCAATNKVGRRDQDFKVTVIVPPDMEGIEDERIATIKGKSVLLQCPITGIPEPSIKWTKWRNDTEIKETSNIILSNNKKILEISNVRLKDDGVYICQGTNEAGSKMKRINVTVLEPPSINDSSFNEDIKVSEGKQAKLKCKTRGRPQPDVAWLHNGHIVDMDNSISSAGNVIRSNNGDEHELTIMNVRVKDAGKYTCLASNEVGVAEKTYRIMVLVAPKLADHEEESNMIESLEGLPITIKCPVQGNPGLDVQWMKDSEPLEAKDKTRARTEGHMLHISNSRPEHSGNYTCVARNNAGNVSKSFQLDVLVPPTLSDRDGEKANYLVTTNDRLKLVCNASGNPPPNIQWFKGVSPLSELAWLKFDLADFNQTLVISDMHTNHSGQYSCVATNMAGTTEMLFNVNVQEPPKMDENVNVVSSNLTVKLHRRLALKCPLSGSPQPTITWYKDGVPVKSGNNVHISSDGKQLHLMQALTKNAGDYDCVAKNVAGTTKLHFHVLVMVPFEWTNWQEWSECSAICGSGEQVRVRSCHSAEHTGKIENCQGESQEWRPCQMGECQIDGIWGTWSSWTSCSESCGRATRRRYRKCDNPEPKYGGQTCLGSDAQQEYCRQAACPVNGRWSEWTDWSECTASCDGGTKLRSRQCNNPAPAYNGRGCRGVDLEIDHCNKNQCPQHGNWASWGRWTPCSTTCGPGNKRRQRSCTAPPPKYGGSPCGGENLQIEKCITRSCDRVPLHASLHVKGRLNGEQLSDSVIDASISDFGPKRTVTASVNDLLKQQPGWFPYLAFMLSPVSWNTAYEMDMANNGYSLTNGNFRQQSQVEFATGEELVLKHEGRGLNQDGALQVDIEVFGDVPIVQSEANVIIDSFEEDYVQTGPNSLYASSTNFLKVNGKKMPYSWNNTVSYDMVQGTMPFLVERLTTRDINTDYDPQSQELRYIMSTEIGRKFDNNKCPEGFAQDRVQLHCSDINECQEPKANRCHSSQICENLFGSYRCYCRPGFKSSAVGKRCLDVNECLQGNAACSHQCVNVKGSYQCSCPDGYTLQPDRKTCTDSRYLYDTDDNNSDPHTKQYPFFRGSSNLKRQRYPKDQETSHFEDPHFHTTRANMRMGREPVTCPNGFSVVNGICQDIDECSVLSTVCNSEQTCLNIKGTYQCLETPCPIDYMKNFHTGSCVKFCNSPGTQCPDGAQVTQTLSYNIAELDSDSIEPFQDLMKMKAHEQNGRQTTKTRYRIVENEKGKPFRVRYDSGQGTGNLYALKQLVPEKIYRIIVLALTYDATGKNILYTTRFVTYIHISNE